MTYLHQLTQSDESAADNQKTVTVANQAELEVEPRNDEKRQQRDREMANMRSALDCSEKLRRIADQQLLLQRSHRAQGSAELEVQRPMFVTSQRVMARIDLMEAQQIERDRIHEASERVHDKEYDQLYRARSEQARQQIAILRRSLHPKIDHNSEI